MTPQRTTIYLSRKLYEKLRVLAFNKRVSQSSIIVTALERYIKDLEMLGGLHP